ncbi:MAG: DUF2752 domain-containing protein [Armatimonadetes bacterium]|nr:DUF2752 domain-containing protein [Armatimonadota bacterium]
MFEPVPSRRFLWPQALYFSAWAGMVAIGIALKPNPDGHGTHTQLGFAPCPSVLLFHRPCPGCGLTTSFSALLHGNLPLAFHAHLLGPPFFVFLTVIALACARGFWQGMRFRIDVPPTSRLMNWVLAVFVIYGFGRFAVMSNYSAGTAAEFKDAGRFWVSSSRK